jgi:transcriptional regulator with XRE-family HTH domain
MGEENETIDVLRQNVDLRITQLGETVASLADRAGLDRRNVSAWLRYGNPTLSTIESLASLCNVPVWSLLDPDFNPKEWPA